MIFSRDRNFYKTFNSLYWILILHNTITFSVNLADNVMIGSYSETALSGVAAVNQIQFIFQQIVMGCGDAAVVICSQYWGQGRTSEIRKIIGSALDVYKRQWYDCHALFAERDYIGGKIFRI